MQLPNRPRMLLALSHPAEKDVLTEKAERSIPLRSTWTKRSYAFTVPDR